MTEPRIRLVEVSGDLFEFIGTRSADGKALSYEWGEPTGHEPDSDRYVYTPTVTATDDGWLAAQRAEAFAAGRAAALGADRRLAAATSQLRTVAAFAHRTDQSHKQSFEDCDRRRCVKAKEVLEYASRPLAAHPVEAEEKPDAV